MLNSLDDITGNHLSDEQKYKMKYERALEIRRQMQEEKEAKAYALKHNIVGHDVVNLKAMGISDVEAERNEEGFYRIYKGHFVHEEIFQTDPALPISEPNDDDSKNFN